MPTLLVQGYARNKKDDSEKGNVHLHACKGNYVRA
jgi:hypothetical protein